MSQCVTCERFGIVNSTIEILPTNPANNEGNNQYICTNKSFCSEHLAKISIKAQKKPQRIKIVRSLQQVDIQEFLDLISEIYIPPAFVCTHKNYVRISCCTLKIMFKKIYEDSPIKNFSRQSSKKIFSYIFSRDIEQLGDKSMFCRTELFSQQMQFRKATPLNFINLSKNKKICISTVLIYYLRKDEMSIEFRDSKETVS